MADLKGLPDESFDLGVHPVSNRFVPAVQPVWNEAFRVLRGAGMYEDSNRPGDADLLSAFTPTFIATRATKPIRDVGADAMVVR